MAAHLSPINILSHCVKFVDLLLPARLFNLTFPLYVCLPYFAEMPFDTIVEDVFLPSVSFLSLS